MTTSSVTWTQEMVEVAGTSINLVKGGSGQAVQNMNVMFGLEETAGLAQRALYP